MKRAFHHLPALSSMHCLQTVRMAILSDRIWFLVVILIGTAPGITQDAEYLVLWPFGFFPYRLWGKLTLEIGFLKVGCVWNFRNTCHRTFPEGSCLLRPLAICPAQRLHEASRLPALCVCEASGQMFRSSLRSLSADSQLLCVWGLGRCSACVCLWGLWADAQLLCFYEASKQMPRLCVSMRSIGISSAHRDIWGLQADAQLLSMMPLAMHSAQCIYEVF